jgi:hypothetical protein
MANELQQPEQVLSKLSAFEHEVSLRHRHQLKSFLGKVSFFSIVIILLLLYILFFIPNGILI